MNNKMKHFNNINKKLSDIDRLKTTYKKRALNVYIFTFIKINKQINIVTIVKTKMSGERSHELSFILLKTLNQLSLYCNQTRRKRWTSNKAKHLTSSFFKSAIMLIKGFFLFIVFVSSYNLIYNS